MSALDAMRFWGWREWVFVLVPALPGVLGLLVAVFVVGPPRRIH